MRIISFLVTITAAAAVSAFYLSGTRPVRYEAPSGFVPDLANGEYMTAAAGCVSCHAKTVSEPPALGGGIEIASPFSPIITPNISSDPKFGIGSWSDDAFLNAVKRGVSPEGEHYYPAFPYSHYEGLTDADILDIKAYLMTLRGVQVKPAQTALPFPFNIRRGLGLWKRADALLAQQQQTVGPERGRYLVEHAAHCGACHTPRNMIYALDRSRAFEGAVSFEGWAAPPITPERLKAVDQEAFVDGVLVYGLRLDGSALNERAMIDVVDQTRRLTREDRKAIYDYLISVD